MKKKQLSRRQLGRINKMQEKFASRASRQESAPELSDDILGPEQKGLVISHFGQQLDIEALEGEHRGQIFRCFQRTNLEPLVAGDLVIWREGDDTGVVVSNLPRKTILKRPAGMGEVRPVAANIDQAIIVIAPQPEPYSNLIDRYLVALENSNIDAIILLNKCDLLNETSRPALEQLLAIYKSISYPALAVSSKQRDGLDKLEELLKGHTSIFVGQSGVGKSALVNALLPGVNTLEGKLSEARDKGRHTTTTARVFHFPSGGDLIDSPGIREFGMDHLDDSEVIYGFREFRPYLGHCQFRDCRHSSEPGCRILEAVEKGKILPNRYHNFLQIIGSENS